MKNFVLAALFNMFFLSGCLSLLTSSAWGDDPSIPPKCRSDEARDDDKCADIIFRRFKERNVRLNQRDKATNAALEQRILTSPTLSGATIDGLSIPEVEPNTLFWNTTKRKLIPQ